MAIFSKTNPSKFDGGDVVTIVGPEAHFNGTMLVRGSLRVEGEVEGNINEAQTVIIGRSGSVEGDVRAERVVVGGTVTGDVFATEQLELIAGGRIVGTIRTKKLLIEEGAIFEGQCGMGVEAEIEPGDSSRNGTHSSEKKAKADSTEKEASAA
jgi:cytoskeletal protein CcmA (bactofilin family)